MLLTLLVEERFMPIPNTLEVKGTGGYDAILNPKNDWYKGQATEIVGQIMVIQGEKLDFESWLKKFGGVWITRGPQKERGSHSNIKWDYVPMD